MMNPKNKILITTLLMTICGVVIYLLYKYVDPSDNVFAPKCISYSMFNVVCPGCGTQRAIYSILNGEILRGIYFNPLIVLSVPYIFLLLVMDLFGLKARLPELYKTLYGQKSIWVVLIILTVYALLRNIFRF